MKRLTLPRVQDLDGVNRALDELRAKLGPLFDLALLDGLLLEDVAIAATDTHVSHLLGREIRGWIVVGKNADARVWRTSTARAASVLTLRASAAVTVSLWVF